MSGEERQPIKPVSKKQRPVLVIVVILLAVLGFYGMGVDKNPPSVSSEQPAPVASLPTELLPEKPTPASEVASAETVLPSEENVVEPIDLSTLSPEVYNEIIEKIKSTPNRAIKASIDSGARLTIFHYSIGPDPLQLGSKDSFLFQIESETYADEQGRQYPNGPVYDLVQMRDIDFDASPDEYWTSDFVEQTSFKPLTAYTPKKAYYEIMWDIGLAHFRTHLLK